MCHSVSAPRLWTPPPSAPPAPAHAARIAASFARVSVPVAPALAARMVPAADRARRRAARIAAHVCVGAGAGAGSGGLLAGRVAIVTGAGRGIGRATVELFAKEGAHVLVSDLDEGLTQEVTMTITSAGGSAAGFAGDVTADDFAERCVAAAAAAFGGELHILVNNAGYTWDGVIHKMTDEQFKAMYDVHCEAPFRLIRAAAPLMRDAGKREMRERGAATPRSIINVSSTSGIHGNAGQVNYAMAKMGVVGMTKTVAKEWGAFGVRCNAIAYGMIATRLIGDKSSGESITVGGKKIALGIPGQSSPRESPALMLTPLRRPGEVSEAAGAMLMLACDHSSYVTGHTLEVTGGFGI